MYAIVTGMAAAESIGLAMQAIGLSIYLRHNAELWYRSPKLWLAWHRYQASKQAA